jgi:hypothetical protein
VDLTALFSAAAAILAAVGGAGAIILALSAWLGKVWATHLMQSDQAHHSRALEELRSDLQRSSSVELERLRSAIDNERDIVLRRRQVYERIAVAMRVFLTGGDPATEKEKREFLAAYGTSMLWAPDQVVDAIGTFLDLNMRVARNPADAEGQVALKRAYAQCLLEMRKDSGFPETEVATYRVVSF